MEGKLLTASICISTWHVCKASRRFVDLVYGFCLQIKLMGTREKAVDVDFSTISMEEEVESQLKEAAVISMGTEVSEADMLNIVALCDQVGYVSLLKSSAKNLGSAI